MTHSSTSLALAAFKNARDALEGGGSFDAARLAEPYRALAPMAHTNALSRVPDFEWCKNMLDFAGGPALFSRVHFETGVFSESPRVQQREGYSLVRTSGTNALENTLTLMVGAYIEKSKLAPIIAGLSSHQERLSALAHACAISAAEIETRLGQHAERFLETLSRTSESVLVVPPKARASFDKMFFDTLLDTGDIIICAGDISALYERLSPYVARHQSEFEKLSQSTERNDHYACVPLLLEQDIATSTERLAQETKDGLNLHNDVLSIRTHALDLECVDEGLKDFVSRAAAQKKQLLCTQNAESFAQLLLHYGARTSSVYLMHPATLSGRLSGALSDGHFLAIPRSDSAQGHVALSLPSLGLAPRETPVVEGAAPFFNALHHAYARGECRALTRAFCFLPYDEANKSQMLSEHLREA